MLSFALLLFYIFYDDYFINWNSMRVATKGVLKFPQAPLCSILWDNLPDLIPSIRYTRLVLGDFFNAYLKASEKACDSNLKVGVM